MLATCNIQEFFKFNILTKQKYFCSIYRYIINFWNQDWLIWDAQLSFFLGALILRGVHVETSGVFSHHFLNSATVQKPGLQTFGEILSTALIHPLWSDLSLGRLERLAFSADHYILWILSPPTEIILHFLFTIQNTYISPFHSDIRDNFRSS